METIKFYLTNPYLREFTDAKVIDIFEDNGQQVFVLDKTIFAPSSGGCPPDKGIILAPQGKAHIFDVKKRDLINLHFSDDLEGIIGKGDRVTCKIDWSRRIGHMRAHTGFHLLTQAFKRVLGDSFSSSGGDIQIDQGRLDITHEKTERISEETVNQVERLANTLTLENRPIVANEISFKEAINRYGELLRYKRPKEHRQVFRVVEIGNFDACACGGVHLASTAEIGLLKIYSHGKHDTMTDRFLFFTGKAAFKYVQQMGNICTRVSKMLSSSPQKLTESITRLQKELKRLQKELKASIDKISELELERLTANVQTMNNVLLYSGILQAGPSELNMIAKKIVDRYEDYIILLGGKDEKAYLLGRASKNVINMGIDLSKILEKAAVIIGGNVGGMPTFVQGGGKYPSKLEDAINAAKHEIEVKLRRPE